MREGGREGGKEGSRQPGIFYAHVWNMLVAQERQACVLRLQYDADSGAEFEGASCFRARTALRVWRMYWQQRVSRVMKHKTGIAKHSHTHVQNSNFINLN